MKLGYPLLAVSDCSLSKGEFELMGIKMLRRRIASVVDWVDGLMGVAVHDVTTGDEIGVSADELFPMASVCKTPILVTAYRRADAGRLSLKKRVEITRQTRTAGSGLLNYFEEGLRPTVQDLLLLMIVVSDNAATDLILQEIEGPEAVTDSMRTLGLDNIRLDRTIQQLLEDVHIAIDPVARGLGYFELESLFESDENVAAIYRDDRRIFAGVHDATVDKDVASPRDIARLYGHIARNECASADSCAAIMKTLERQQLRGRLPRNLPPHTRCCHKTGTLGNGNVCNDTGLIFVGDRPIAVAVLSKDVKQEPADTNTAIARIGRIVYDHFAA
jgi:beta-lactamase class A